MNNGIIISEDNPFKSAIEQMQKSAKITEKRVDGILAQRRITLTLEENYIPLPFTKLFKNKEVLTNLSPYACKILVYIALNMEYGTEKIRIRQWESGLSRRVYPKAMTELVFNRIIVKEKREWYWINLTLLIVGNIRKHE